MNRLKTVGGRVNTVASYLRTLDSFPPDTVFDTLHVAERLHVSPHSFRSLALDHRDKFAPYMIKDGGSRYWGSKAAIKLAKKEWGMVKEP